MERSLGRAGLLPALLACAALAAAQEVAPQPAPRWEILAFVSADCARCRTLERETLEDPRVVAALGDVTVRLVGVGTGPGRVEARRHGVRRLRPGSLPELVFLRDGRAEARQSGGLSPLAFLDVWRLVRAAGPWTRTGLERDVARAPRDEVGARLRLASHLAWVGDEPGLREQIAALERLTGDPSSYACAAARDALHRHLLWRLRDEAAEAAECGELLDPRPIEGLLAEVRDPCLVLPAARLLADTLAARIERASEPEERRALVGRWAGAARDAWRAGRGLEQEDFLSWAASQAGLAWERRALLEGEARALALEIAEGLLALRPEGDASRLLLARGAFLAGERERAGRVAAELFLRTGSGEARALLAELER